MHQPQPPKQSNPKEITKYVRQKQEEDEKEALNTGGEPLTNFRHTGI